MTLKSVLFLTKTEKQQLFLPFDFDRFKCENKLIKYLLEVV